MLKPDERAHLLELLRPPSGCHLDRAVGTTFSLDLLSALTVPLSFAFFDWEHPDGQPAADPIVMLEALRRYGDKFTIFCQAGQIRLPSKYPPLVTFLEPCVYEVQPIDDAGVFHPKVWALRFISDESKVFYRVLCLSRNLTFDRCWDTVVALDGELTDREKAFAANHPLGDFFDALPGLVLPPRKMPLERREGIQEMADELRRVRFSMPEGVEDCRFHVGGLDRREAQPFGEPRKQTLIVSPFLTERVVKDFVESSGATFLVSRPESLQDISRETLRACEGVHFLAPQATGEINEDEPQLGREEILDGLHAKLFVIDRGWNASVFTGSFNATSHALKHNVEFMVELVGKRSRLGVDQFLSPGNGETVFADLLRPYDPEIESVPTDPAQRQLDELIQCVKKGIAKGRPKLAVKPSGEMNLFDLWLEWKRPPRWPKTGIDVRVWPITQPRERSQSLADEVDFPRLSYQGLTPLFAFAISVEVAGAKSESVFVMNLPLEGMPEDRDDRVLSSLLTGQELRYILFLLSSGDEGSTASAELVKLMSGDGQTDGRGALSATGLFETLVRALHRSPAQLERVDSLLESLKRAGASTEGSILLDPEFQKIWEPIWEVAKRDK